MLGTLSNSNQGLPDKKAVLLYLSLYERTHIMDKPWSSGQVRDTHYNQTLCFGQVTALQGRGQPLVPIPSWGAQGSLTPTQTSCTFLLWKDGLRKQKEINPQTPLTGILSVLLSFQTSKSATTMSLSSVRDKTPSRSTSNTLKQTEGKGNDFAVRTTPQGLSLFLAAP